MGEAPGRDVLVDEKNGSGETVFHRGTRERVMGDTRKWRSKAHGFGKQIEKTGMVNGMMLHS